MGGIRERIVEKFGDRLRIRVCGLCVEEGRILLVNHHSLNNSGDFWSPPGGGMDYASSAEENLKREFKEETGIDIVIDRFLFVHEYLRPPLHAIEMFFRVQRLAGEVEVGYDPEMDDQEQIIKDAKFIHFNQVKKMDNSSVHQLFRNFSNPDELLNAAGYFIWKE
jgi:8-oxo-dGTP diphosphatase